MAEFGPRIRFKEQWRNLTREQRISVGIFGVCGIITLGLSFAHLRATIQGPFMVPKSLLVKSQNYFAGQEDALKNQERQKTKDTDRDGLTDYDELNKYRTSPYLADSDSDRVQDMVEIAQGTDPNCPAGKPCVQRVDTVIRSSTSSGDFQDLLQAMKVPLAPTEVFLSSASSETEGARDFLARPPDPSQMTPPQIREYLLSHNLVRSDQLSVISDEELVRVYKAAYEEALRAQSITKGQPQTVP